MLKNGPLTHLYSMRAAEDQNADVTAVASRLRTPLYSPDRFIPKRRSLCLPLEALIKQAG
jgi:hypothetical protein